jgi:hypothetical protein
MQRFTSDNGPHLDKTEETGDRTQQQATNGLRQCKASLFEGGIRVPGRIAIHMPFPSRFLRTHVPRQAPKSLARLMSDLRHRGMASCDQGEHAHILPCICQ